MRLSRKRFESLVASTASQVVLSLPEDLRLRARDVLFAVEDLPPRIPGEPYEDDLLGLYEGTPLPERSVEYAPVLPDQITLFWKPLTEMCDSLAELREEIRMTIIHELGHFFGFSEEELEQRGLG